MKLLKNKTTIGILSIVFGLIICFGLTPLYNASIEAKVKIVRVKKYVAKGEVITNDVIEIVEVGKYNLPNNIYLTSEEVLGKYAANELFEDEYIIKSKLTEVQLVKHDYLESLEGDRKAISITLQSFAAGLSGKLLPGDIISITITDQSDKTTMIPLELQYVKVLASTTSAGKDVDENTGIDKENIAVTVTLLVNDMQSQLLSNYEETKKMHISLVYRGTETKCNELLKEQEEIIKEILDKLNENEEEITDDIIENIE